MMNNRMMNNRTDAIRSLICELAEIDPANFSDSMHDDFINDLADLICDHPLDDESDAFDNALDAAAMICNAIRPDLYN